jgi:hypothetical protein
MYPANYDFADPLDNMQLTRQTVNHKSEYVRRRSNLVTQQPAELVKLIRSGESLNLANRLAESQRFKPHKVEDNKGQEPLFAIQGQL